MRVVAIRGGLTTRFDRFGPPAQHDLLRRPGMPPFCPMRCREWRQIRSSEDCPSHRDRPSRRPARGRRHARHRTRACPAAEPRPRAATRSQPARAIAPPGTCRRNANEREATRALPAPARWHRKPRTRPHAAPTMPGRSRRKPNERGRRARRCARSGRCSNAGARPRARRVPGASRQAGSAPHDGTPCGRQAAYRPSCVASWPISDTS